jgi:hypothetical protein
MSSVKKITQIFAVSVGLIMVLIFSQSIPAQETRGNIRGIVTDPNKAAVAGASVKIVDTARGTTTNLTTNDDGYYQANYLIPSTYQIIVEANGFKKTIRENVVLQISQSLSIDVALEIGGNQETVTVTTETPALETSNASVSQTVDQRRIEELPLVHGDPYKLIGLSTGVTYTGSARLDRPFEPTHIVGFAIDGTRGNRSDLTIDGAPSTATANANEVIATYVPPTDIVQEFKVQTATFDAQFGNTEGGVTSISIKSGANSLNGSAYYFGEPGSWAANDFFGNARKQARPESKSDRFGGYISGPIMFPWLYNGKDKSFFLFGYEGIRDSRPRFDAGQSVWIPTEALKNGDFSAYQCPAPPAPQTNCINIYDPLTRVASGNSFVGTQFANNIIPANRINPIARAVLEYMGSPKQPGLNGNIFDSTLTEVTKPYDNYTFRIDQNITSKNHFFVRGSVYNRNSLYNRYTDSPYVGVNFVFKARQGVIDDVHTFNSTTFLNVRYGYNRFIRGQDQQDDAQGFDLTELGFSPSYNSLIPDAVRRFPRFDFPANTVLGNGMSNEFRPVTTHSFAAILNKIIGTHAFKFGSELRIYREDDSFASNDQTGQFIFDNAYTRQNSASGTDFNGLQAFAAFLLGLPTTQQIVRRADYSEYSKTYGFFVQDDWKVNNRLTLNMGLRYEIETPLVERQDKSVSGFDLGYTQPIEATVRQRLTTTPVTGINGQPLNPSNFNVKGGLLFAGLDGGSGLYETPKNTFLPRFGVAYQLNEKTVLRGGFGMFAGFLGERRGDVIQPGFTRTTTLPTTTLASGATIPNLISTFPGITILEPVGNAQGKQSGLGTGISFFNQNPEVSKQFRYQVGVQRELPWNFVVEAMYVGNYGFNIEIARNINALPNEYLNTDSFRSQAQTDRNALLAQTVANPFAGLLPGTNFNNATIARSQLLRPFPQFGDITTSVNDGKSWYHSGQFTLNRRMSNGYTFGASYTWSKWLQATEFLNAGDAEPTKMISDQDSPHRISFSFIYELPFGKGKSYLANNSVLDRIVGGWQVQGIYQYQVGFPIRLANDAFFSGSEIDLSIPSYLRTTDRWFNTTAFVSVNNGATSATATPVSHLRTLPFFFNELRRDNINNVDLSMLKNTRINEKMRIQFKLDLINALNEPYFPAPVVNPTQTTFGSISASNQDNYARRIQYGIKFLF